MGAFDNYYCDCQMSLFETEEEWKPIKGFEGSFSVSNIGRVRSDERVVGNHTGSFVKKERILKLQTTHKGYKSVTISKKGYKKTYQVHRLVAFAFIPNNENKPQVNHIDGNKQNNNVNNLEWCNNSENQIHAYRIGLNNRSKDAGRKKKPVLQIDLVTHEVVGRFDSIAEASRKVHSTNIVDCCRGKRNHAKGFAWKYESEVV